MSKIIYISAVNGEKREPPIALDLVGLTNDAEDTATLRDLIAGETDLEASSVKLYVRENGNAVAVNVKSLVDNFWYTVKGETAC
jgi:hypothetical protein